MLLAGDRDVEAGAVSFRFGDRTQINGVPPRRGGRRHRQTGSPTATTPRPPPNW